MDSRYNHTKYEDQIYQLWEKSGVFNPDSEINQKRSQKTNKPFCIIMPPPNANDPLHIGHALGANVQDILIRYHRMLGDDTLWLPGADHAGIETQFVFEKKLKKKKQSRFNFDRKTLYQMIWDYVQENSKIAMNQKKRFGASADWSRYKFTLDPEVISVALETFVQLDEDDLLYRDRKLVNYCTKCGTAFSELEVVYDQQKTDLYYVRYPLSGVDFNPTDPKTYVVVATTRPEPIFADTHLAIHPDDKNHQYLLDKTVLNPLTNKKMGFIVDDFIDPEFGTGIVKLTPAHDFNDFGAAKKHHLPIIEAIDSRGKITKIGGKYRGLSVLMARKQVVEDLQEKNLIEKIDSNYKHRIGTCYRCKKIIEPLPLSQFFIKVKPLVDPVVSALDKKQIKIIGAGHDKILMHWLKNLRDWNISRQIVWGIRIPAWYNIKKNPDLYVVFIDKNKKIQRGKISEFIDKNNFNNSVLEIQKGLQQLQAPASASYTVSLTSPGEEYIQETDTFDTWFSSSQWPLSTLLTSKENDFKRFYPTSVMETAHDILMFWVMRMLMMGIYKTGKIPFEYCLLHGLIRDEKGDKMSKSKGNVTNPLDVISKYGADALRLALVIRTSPGLDKTVGEPDFKAARNFTNKLWNATRYIVTTNDEKKSESLKTQHADNDFHKKMNSIIKEISKLIENYKIGLAIDLLHNYFWHWFCDECIERNKKGELSQKTLLEGLKIFIILLHPFLPFITETIWQNLIETQTIQTPHQILATHPWPQ